MWLQYFDNTRQVGMYYESQARRYLEQAGLDFIAANVKVGRGELDLIMRDGQTLVFVEVRYRFHTAFGGALASITRQKQRHLRQSAALWLAQQGDNAEETAYRFDVLAITGNQLQWLPNAFGADE